MLKVMTMHTHTIKILQRNKPSTAIQPISILDHHGLVINERSLIGCPLIPPNFQKTKAMEKRDGKHAERFLVSHAT